MRKSWWSLILSLSLALVSLGGAAVWAQKPPVHITVLQLNDVYDLPPVDKGQRGGLARVATLVKRIEAENPHTYLVLGGDTLSPSIASRSFQGRQMIEAWNALGLDVAVLGNHEFDYGDGVLKARIQESRFPWLGANVIDKATGQPFSGVKSSVIFDVEGIQLGFFGLLTPDTQKASHPGPGVQFEDPRYAACRAVSALRNAGVDVVIGLTHLTMNEDKQVAASLAFPRLTAVMGGHEHTLLQSLAGGVPIFKVGSDARTLGRLDIWVNPGSGMVESMDWSLIPVDASVSEDPALAQLAASYEAKLQEALGQPIGKTAVTLDALQEHNRRRETNLGNFVADAYRQALGAEVALLNGGSIRSNTTYDPGGLTRRDLLSVMPFNDRVIKTQVKGSVLKAALENGFSRLNGEEAGRFPQVSGMTISYDGRKPVGSRVVKVMVGGKPLDPKRPYTLATTSYLLEGGDDYAMLREARWLMAKEEGPMDAALVEEAIRAQGTIAPRVEGRITRLDPAP